eukprot:COSAG02_NODE_1987_length_10178_cov_66.992216_7_plen_105_part_00
MHARACHAKPPQLLRHKRLRSGGGGGSNWMVRWTSAQGLVWDCRVTEADLSTSLADERAWLRCLGGYAGSGGSEWVGGETDSDDDYYFPNGGSDSDDCDAYDYL